ncbi:MAG: hypothetical protein ACKO4A_05070 [Gammaproteobacteria bacterium]
MRQLGGAFGVNLMSVVLERRRSVHADQLAATQTWGNSDTMDSMQQLQGLGSAIGHVGTDQWNAAVGFLRQMVEAQALQAGFSDSFVILAFAFLLTMLPTLALRTRQRAKPGPAAQATTA